jgi:sodium/potassium/calcium exchanger 6
MMVSNRTIRKIQLDPQRHRFHNKAAFLLTLATLVLLIALASIFGEFDDSHIETSRWLEEPGDDDGHGNGNYAKYSCRYIYNIVPNAGYEQCRFARTCNDGQGVWAPFVFCHYNKSRAITLFLIISPVMIIWMVTLFRLLGSTAEDFFSPSLEMFSVKLGLPPRFAGVSLLALGNGAADVSATMSAIVNDVDNGYKLSLGALTGAAMLVGGVVAGLVVLVADGVPCRGALVRDVTALFITVCVVWANLSTGKIGPGSTTLFLSMYGVFASIVLVADVYHRAVVLPRIRTLQARLAATGSIEGDGIMQGDITMDPGPPAVLSRVMTALSNYDNVPPGEAPPTDETAEWGISSDTIPTAQQQGTSLQESDAPIILHGQHGILSPPRHHPHLEASLGSPAEVDGGGAYELVQDPVDQLCVAPGSVGFSASNWSGAIHDGKQEVITAFSEAWEDIAYNGDLNVAEKAMMICEFPFTALRKVRIRSLLFDELPSKTELPI